MRELSNARDAFQETFYYLRPVHLKIRLTHALEEYICNCISQTPMLFDSLSEGGGCLEKKIIAKTYHLQGLRFSKVSNVCNINSSFGNPHLAFILTNQCLTIMAGSGTVINIYLL